MARAGSGATTDVPLGTILVMPRVHVIEFSELPPARVLSAARDFSARRADLWPDVHVEHLHVHEQGEDYAVVTEGNPWPIGTVWERVRYDWTDPQEVRGTVLASNLFRPGSTWEIRAVPWGEGSRVEITAVRHLRGRGWLLAPFFLPGIPGSASATVREHLRHFLAQVRAT